MECKATPLPRPFPYQLILALIRYVSRSGLLLTFTESTLIECNILPRDSRVNQKPEPREPNRKKAYLPLSASSD